MPARKYSSHAEYYAAMLEKNRQYKRKNRELVQQQARDYQNNKRADFCNYQRERIYSQLRDLAIADGSW